MALPFFGIGIKKDFCSPVATAEFFKLDGVLSAAFSQHHLSGLQMVIAAMKLKDDYSFEEKL